MKILSLPRFIIISIAAFIFFSCDEKEEFKTDQVIEYIPLQKGKYITYRVDSIRFTNFGRNTEIFKYQVKHVIDSVVSDNLGRTSYRINRYIRDTAGLQPWQTAGVYSITPLNDQIEVIEDNLRFIKLHLPLRDGYSWKGNRFLPPDPYGSLYTFSNDDNMEDWDYYYDGESTSFSYAGKNYTDVFTVEQVNEAFNVPITDPGAYAARSRSVERYSKDIGLVYRELELWEYQPNPGGPSPYKIGFGIKMWMIDHN